MPPDDYSTAELSRAVQRIEADVHEIKTDVKAQSQIYATKEYVAEVKESLGREIRDIRLTQQSRSVPWPHVVTAIVAILALAVTLIPLIAKP